MGIREALPSELAARWDLVVVGGGITGAGILLEAVRAGLQVLLVEARDFAWGTSSRSSKLVHGGLRYLREGRFALTRASVIEREHLLRQAPGLVDPIELVVPVFAHRGPGRAALRVGLPLYDLIAGRHAHRYLNRDTLAALLPGIREEGLEGGYRFVDAQTDDARLVLRVLDEAVRMGAWVRSYTAARTVCRAHDGHVAGVDLQDKESGAVQHAACPVIVNATGFWAERLQRSPREDEHLRPLRGSHLMIPAERLPLPCAVTFPHPADLRPVFALPWEGAVLLGTTDLDHDQDPDTEPVPTTDEVDYLLEGLNDLLPGLTLTPSDCTAAFAGVRPVVSRGDRAPSRESREHVVWADKGLVTVTGGKLTTFRRLAWDALAAAAPWLPDFKIDPRRPVFAAPPAPPETEVATAGWRQRLWGRYGPEAAMIWNNADREEETPIPGTSTLWAELPFAAKHEQVRHLSDLLLRRVRIGLLTPGYGKAYLGRVRKICRPYLPWSHRQWKNEANRYLAQCRQAHGLPPGLQVTDAKKAAPLTAFKAFWGRYAGKLFSK